MFSTQKTEELLIWGLDGQPPRDTSFIALWSSYDVSELSSRTVVSVPEQVEGKSDILRKRFLAWLYELSEVNIKNKRLVDHLEIRDGFSYWWMTLLSEKNYGKSENIYDALRLFVIEDLIREYQPCSIMVVGLNDKVTSCIKQLCTRFKIQCNQQFSLTRKAERKSIKNILSSSLPYGLQGICYFIKKIGEYRPLRWHDKKPVAMREDGLLFVDYLAHLSPSTKTKGKFASNYWTTLIDCLDSSHNKVNWLHFYVKHEAVPSREKACELISKFGRSNDKQVHACVGDSVGIRLLCATFVDYCSLFYRSIYLRKIKNHFTPSNSNLNFWSLFRDEWFASLRGKYALHNCLTLNMLETILKSIPTQKVGFYLQENLSWEMAFIYAWRKCNHGRLIGVPHATVRYWDLRYYYDPRHYVQGEAHSLPMPDYVAVNGRVSRRHYLQGSYPAENLIDVEALRYLYLRHEMRPRALPHVHGRQTRLLICGDILDSLNRKMMRCLEVYIREYSPAIVCTLKPHPARKIDLQDYSLIVAEQTNVNLCELFEKHDVMLTSASSSAAVDAYCAKLPVIQVLDGSMLNTSPLRGMPGVAYVENAAQLANQLIRIRNNPPGVTPEEDYFYLDEALPRWRQLLNLEIPSQEKIDE